MLSLKKKKKKKKKKKNVLDVWAIVRKVRNSSKLINLVPNHHEK